MMKNGLLALDAGSIGIILVVVAVLIVVMLLLMLMTRVKTCPPDKVLVVYGKNRKNNDGTSRSSKCVHGGIAFIAPFVQKYTYLDLTPLSISVDLKSALSKQNIRIDVPCIFTVGISTDPAIMQNAAERLLGLTLQNISDLAKDIIFGQLRLVIATMEIEEINTDRDKFLDAISRNVEGELKKIGLKLINVNVTDISDESGYIIALGKEAAAKAITLTTHRDEAGRRTAYRARLKLDAFGLDDRMLTEGIRFNLLINDNDGNLREGFIQLAPGVSEWKNFERFPLVVFD